MPITASPIISITKPPSLSPLRVISTGCSTLFVGVAAATVVVVAPAALVAAAVVAVAVVLIAVENATAFASGILSIALEILSISFDTVTISEETAAKPTSPLTKLERAVKLSAVPSNTSATPPKAIANLSITLIAGSIAEDLFHPSDSGSDREGCLYTQNSTGPHLFGMGII